MTTTTTPESNDKKEKSASEHSGRNDFSWIVMLGATGCISGATLTFSLMAQWLVIIPIFVMVLGLTIFGLVQMHDRKREKVLTSVRVWPMVILTIMAGALGWLLSPLIVGLLGKTLFSFLIAVFGLFTLPIATVCADKQFGIMRALGLIGFAVAVALAVSTGVHER